MVQIFFKLVDSCLLYNKFHQFDCIKDENQLKDLTKVSLKVFNLLLSFLSDSNKNLFDIKSQLLLFLIKIKSGITFSALSVFLKISHKLLVCILNRNCNV